MPEKVTIAYRGAKYEIGRGKRYYGIWVAGAPASDPIDRWPENRDGWTQAWIRFTAMETPGTISPVGKPRAIKLAPGKRADSNGRSAISATARGLPDRATVAAGLIGLGVLLGLIGLFPGYVVSAAATGPQSLASSNEELVPHLIYLVAWAVSGAAIALGARRATGSRVEILRMGALLGSGLSAVTFGLFFFDLGQVISGGSLGAGLLLSLLGWLACASGSVLALFARPRVAVPAAPAGEPPAAQEPAGQEPAGQEPAGQEPAAQEPAGQEPAGQQPATASPAGQGPATATSGAGQPAAGPARVGPVFAWPSSSAAPPAPFFAGTSPAGSAFAAAPPGRVTEGGPARPRAADAGPIALVLLAAIGAVAAFAPSWDRFTFTQAATGATQTITQGNAFAFPGAMIAGNVAAMVAVIAVAVLAALWRPVRHGALLLAGATIPLAAQAISALIQASQPANPALFGISPSDGVTITSGVTPIFWVYCVFVISLVVSCAWMLTAPRYQAMPRMPQSSTPWPVHVHPAQRVDDKDGDSGGDDAEDDAESTYA